jgi:hypothetical protein
VSPLFELDKLLRKLSSADPYRLPGDWSARLRPILRRLRAETDLDAVLALFSRHYGAGFLAPPPEHAAQTVEQDLAAVRATPLPVARTEIANCLDRRPCTDERTLALLRRKDVVDRVADTLQIAWQELLAADWLTLRAILERDIAHRARLLSRAGWATAIAGLDHRLR